MNPSLAVSDLTVGELQELIRQTVADMLTPRTSYVYGLDGICEIFGCSRSTAKRIKASGTIDKAISQQGRTFVVNVERAIQLYGKARN